MLFANLEESVLQIERKLPATDQGSAVLQSLAWLRCCRLWPNAAAAVDDENDPSRDYHGGLNVLRPCCGWKNMSNVCLEKAEVLAVAEGMTV